ncbi:MAG: hypothetical protein IH624_17060 [Phycisphaerae bacterium]|nr:hypothetical protein [Phycisphaerae bacterium]
MKFKRLGTAVLATVMAIMLSAAQAGQGMGDQPQNTEQTRTTAQKKKNINNDQDKTSPRIQKRPRDRVQGGVENVDTLLKGNGAGPGDGDGDGEPIQDRTRTQDKKQDCVGPLGEPKQDQTRDQKRDQLQDGSCGDDAFAVLKGNGAGPGDGDGEGEPIQDRTRTQDKKQDCVGPVGEPKQDQTRDQKRDQLQDGSCGDDAAAVLKGNGAGPGDGDGDGEPIQDRTRTQDRKKICLSPNPRQLKIQERTQKQTKTQTGVSEDDEFTPEFLIFLKSYFAEVDARQQREGEASQVQARLRLMKKAGDVDPAGEAQKTMLRARKSL